tara:strand:+ start:395 stop:2755 length:2361 start_codon:yes stop_codon:yes gene_type:complete
MKTKLDWQDFVRNKVPIRRGVFALNQAVMDDISACNEGFYVYTYESRWIENTYKTGQTINGISDRLTSAEQAEQIIIVGWIASKNSHIKNFDQEKLHRKWHNEGKSTWIYLSDPNRFVGKEWSEYPNDNPVDLLWEELKESAIRRELKLCGWQILGLIQLGDDLLSDKKIIMAEYAARLGKTILFLILLYCSKYQVMVVSSYYLSSFNSFKQELRRFAIFKDFESIDLSDLDFKNKFDRAVSTGNNVVVFNSLCGDHDSSSVKHLSDFDSKIEVVDEADFGSHTAKISPRVDAVKGDSPLILTTGTNSQRAKGTRELDAFHEITYEDMQVIASEKQEILIKGEGVFFNRLAQFSRDFDREKNLVKFIFHRMDYSREANALCNLGVDESVNPSWKKVTEDVDFNRPFFNGYYQSLVGVSTPYLIQNGIYDTQRFAVDHQIGEPTKSVLQFFPHGMRTRELNKLADIVKSTPVGQSWEIVVINGDHTTNEKAENEVNIALNRAIIDGKRGVWILASAMCQRSFSIPHINLELISYDNGEIAPLRQKMSRVGSIGNGKINGHVISTSIDGNRDTKLIDILAEMAKKYAHNNNVDFETALKLVAGTIPMFDLAGNHPVQLTVDDYSEYIFNSSNSSYLTVNKDSVMTIDENSESLNILCKIDPKSDKKRKAKNDLQKGDTFELDEKDSSNSREIEKAQKDLHKQLIEKLKAISENIHYLGEATLTNSFDDAIQTLREDSDLNDDFKKDLDVNADELSILVNDKMLDKQMIETRMMEWNRKQNLSWEGCLK